MSRRVEQAFSLLSAILIATAIVTVCALQRESADPKSSSFTRLLWPFVASDVAEGQYQAGMLLEARRSALAALRVKPGDVTAIRVLALVDDDRGLPQQALALMAVGTRWSWRDSPTQIWLFRRLRDAGEFNSAIIHGEALVARQQDEDEIFKSFTELAADRRNLPALVDAITRGASWRRRFYDYLGNAPAAVQPGLVNLMTALSDTSIAPAESDWEPLLTAMLNSGNGKTARALWLARFRKRASEGPISDPGFDDLARSRELGDEVGLFDWKFDPTAQLYAVPDPTRRTSNALYIARAGVSHEPLVEQRLVLPEGRYVLTFRLRAERPETRSLVRVAVECRPGNQEIGEPYDLTPGSGGWETVHLHFLVQSGCTSEELAVEPVGTQSGQTLGVWIDDFTLDSGS